MCDHKFCFNGIWNVFTNSSDFGFRHKSHNKCTEAPKIKSDGTLRPTFFLELIPEYWSDMIHPN